MEPEDEVDDDTAKPLDSHSKVDLKKCSALFQRRTILLALMQGIPGCIPGGVLGTYLNDYLSYDVGFSTTEATFVMVSLGVGFIAGQLIGGTVGQWLYNRNPAWQCLFMGLCTALSAFPMLYVLNIKSIPLILYGVDSWTSKQSMYSSIMVACVLTGSIAGVTGPNIRSIMQNVSPPELRGTLFSVFNLTDDLGRGGGPYLISLLTEYSGSRRFSFSCGVGFWVISGSILASMAFTVRADEMAARQRIHAVGGEIEAGQMWTNKLSVAEDDSRERLLS